MSILRRAGAVAALAGSALAAGLLPAMTASAVTQTISITASSKIKVTHDVLVIYQGGSYASATISGTITGGTGDTAELMATPFGGTAAQVGSTITVSSSPQSYSFTVKPSLATSYQLELLSGSTVVTTSAAKTVYVAAQGKISGGKTCARPVCHETFRIAVIVPASALKTEMAKHNYAYFNVNLSKTGTPKAPKWLYLGRGHASVTKPKKLTAGKFSFSVSFRFTVGNDGYYWAWNLCSKDAEAKDGLGLPGTHGCGAKRVSATATYLG
jgi:hypothetical protein